MKKMWILLLNLTAVNALLFTHFNSLSAGEPTGQSSAAATAVAPGTVEYRLICQYSVERLNRILTTELAEFSTFPVQYPAAKNAVNLYEVLYTTVIPESDNRPVRVSGLLAIPQVAETTLPVLSYQHGTVFSRNEVPSRPENSMETRLAVACFAGNGYIVAAADYIGKGISDEPDGWLVKECTAQACFDLLNATQNICAKLKLTPGKLFLSGWSQGSFSTAALLNRLEKNNIPVAAAAMASAPNDIYLTFNRWIHVASPLDVNWLVGAAILMVNSYENYYRLPGLAATAIKPQYLQTARDLYANRITWTEAAEKLPPKVSDLFQDDFISRKTLMTSRFFEQLRQNTSYRWRFNTPAFYYYGDIDEVVTPYMVQLPVEYQKALGGVLPQAIGAGAKANHRGTFVFGLADQQKRFAALLSR